MRRFGILGLATLLAVSAVAPASAGWLKRWTRDAQRNNAWPRPFIAADREAVAAPFAVMTQKGWERQNTLTEFHFREGTNELNDAGRRKVAWIVTQGPSQYRIIQVEKSIDAEDTAARIAAVEDAATRFSVDQSAVQVVETAIPGGGWPGQYAEAVDTKFRDSIADPRLPPVAGSGGVASGS